MSKVNKAWILVGMMGAGKTTVGKELAKLSDRSFVDTDELVENKMGKNISELFSTYGEAEFRRIESSIIHQIDAQLHVVATGGGSIMDKDNFQHLTNIGILIYLKTTPEILIQRLQHELPNRPMLNKATLADMVQTLLLQREEQYLHSHIVFDTSNQSPSHIANGVLQEILRLTSSLEKQNGF
jgi:shikimate kinase